MSSWVPVAADSDFPVQNLPFGVFAPANRVGVAIGSYILDISRLDVPYRDDFARPSLNAFLSRGRSAWHAVRQRLTELLCDESYRPEVTSHLVPMSDATMRMPIEVADYVDFYAFRDHAENVGRIFRPGADPLTPNWTHLPIGYHGRAGTVGVSPARVVRPCGQRKAPADPAPTFGPSERLDIEAELGFVVGVGSQLGERVRLADIEEHVFGVVLLNDWSARDIQAWEYVPLGPFLGKSFATTISPWVVPLEALESAKCAPPPQEPEPLPYLRDGPLWGLDIELEVSWNSTVVCHPPCRYMYWTPAAQLAHLTVNGASLRTGDLYGSGTVSGPRREQVGSFLELTRNGADPVRLGDGGMRGFLADGDTVTIRGRAVGQDGVHIGFGELTGTVVPARP